MKFKIGKGDNFKLYVGILDLKTKQDFEYYDLIVKALSRKEYLPYAQGFNKNISDSYLFDDIIFPVQFLADVLKVLNNMGFNPEIINKELIQYPIDREEFDTFVENLNIPEKYNTKDEKYIYQQDAVYLGIKNRIGYVDIAVAGGKTFIAYMYCRYAFDFIFGESKKILVVVPTKPLANQFKRDFAELNAKMERPLSVETIFAGSKRLLDADIVCGTYHSLSNYDSEYFDMFGVMICDEAHRAKAYSIKTGIFDKLLNCEFFFGMTGTTPDYKTLDYLHITSMFGSSLVTREIQDLIDDKVATDILISVIQIDYVEDHDFALNLKEEGIIGTDRFYAEKHWFQNNPYRTMIIAKLLNAYHRNSMIFVATVEYCNILQVFLSEYCPDWTFKIVNGKTPLAKREEFFEEARNCKEFYCIIGTYECISTGLNIPSLANGYLPDGGKSDNRVGQGMGRFVRLFAGKTQARLFDIYDNMPGSSFKKHFAVRRKYYNKKRLPQKITITKI